MKKYTTLLFDSDDTLLDFKAAEYSALMQMMSDKGLPFSPQNAEIYSQVNKGFWEAFERGEIEKKEIYVGRFGKFFESINVSADAVSAAATYEGNLGKNHQLISGAMALLKELYGKYEIYIVTNGRDCIQKQRLKDSNIINYVSGVFISETVGAPKPDKKYFDYVFDNITEKDLSKILIIGDSMSSDILGGINAGIDTCWYNPSGKTPKYTPTYEISTLSELGKILGI